MSVLSDLGPFAFKTLNLIDRDFIVSGQGSFISLTYIGVTRLLSYCSKLSFSVGHCTESPVAHWIGFIVLLDID
jgi:hypothetical protein